MSDLKPITVFAHATGPNPWKVIMILEELGLPYEKQSVDLSQVKSEPYTSINPNGRVPAIIDPNTNITLWESGAIIEYLIETYDKDHKLSHASSPEKFFEKQYLAFQISGQGPYFGQAAWFRRFHPEDLPSAKKRYDDQAMRVWAVLDKILEGREWLVGDKCTYADIAFVTWNDSLMGLYGDEWAQMVKPYPNALAWHERVCARPMIKKVMDERAVAIAEFMKNMK